MLIGAAACGLTAVAALRRRPVKTASSGVSSPAARFLITGVLGRMARILIASLLLSRASSCRDHPGRPAVHRLFRDGSGVEPTTTAAGQRPDRRSAHRHLTPHRIGRQRITRQVEEEHEHDHTRWQLRPGTGCRGRRRHRASVSPSARSELNPSATRADIAPPTSPTTSPGSPPAESEIPGGLMVSQDGYSLQVLDDRLDEPAPPCSGSASPTTPARWSGRTTRATARTCT